MRQAGVLIGSIIVDREKERTLQVRKHRDDTYHMADQTDLCEMHTLMQMQDSLLAPEGPTTCSGAFIHRASYTIPLLPLPSLCSKVRSRVRLEEGAAARCFLNSNEEKEAQRCASGICAW